MTGQFDNRDSSMIQSIGSDGYRKSAMAILDHRDSNDEKNEKANANISEETLYADFFAGTYLALMKKYKMRYSLAKED